ncbi:hypothetical protein MAPG_04134 [Magnaporthiopsis poae ATCC 64411]|uniref:Uncharacterized protein n=1 Tax=Magnaporthiopsis poae (strain ATCC 64411 / 73-15) TaxID=644358 RepID=A0A0C4DVX1_MAGP6|nr:hypothetical protein MAPG_04134 [Magnaporthiopsis poae ATCC 64411]
MPSCHLPSHFHFVSSLSTDPTYLNLARPLQGIHIPVYHLPLRAASYRYCLKYSRAVATRHLIESSIQMTGGEHASSQSASGAASSQPQQIPARPVDPRKLLTLLDNRFGRGQYRVVMQHDKFNIRASSRLTYDDIRTHCFHDEWRY